MPLNILIRGGGDLATGAGYRLFKSGFRILITELPQPMSVRRLVSFSQAVYDRSVSVEGVKARLADSAVEAFEILDSGDIPVLIDPQAEVRRRFAPKVIVDGRMTKLPPDLGMEAAGLVIGLGPGFEAGINCHAVVETKRGPFLGRVFWNGSAEPDTGQPDSVADRQTDRVLRAPCAGVFESLVQIGDVVDSGQEIARISGEAVRAAFPGIVRGLIQPGIRVKTGVKIGDIDPRMDPRLSTHISDKALAVGGGVLEAILSRADLRSHLWE